MNGETSPRPFDTAVIDRDNQACVCLDQRPVPSRTDTIFDEYRQVAGSDREGRGTGLGLSITKKFAELLGGSIGVESRVGAGSTFTVRVPVVCGEG